MATINGGFNGKLTKKLVQNLGPGQHGDGNGHVTLSDVCFGGAQAILNTREKIIRKILETRYLQHCKFAA